MEQQSIAGKDCLYMAVRGLFQMFQFLYFQELEVSTIRRHAGTQVGKSILLNLHYMKLMDECERKQVYRGSIQMLRSSLCIIMTKCSLSAALAWVLSEPY